MKRMCSWRQPNAAFTLIELLVVVSIIAVLASIAVPALFSLTERRRAKELKQEQLVAAARQEDGATFAPGQGVAPIIESAKFAMALETSGHRIGLEQYTRHRLRCDGSLEISPVGKSERRVISIPFPPSTTDAWDVRLLASLPGESKPAEPPGVVYSPAGILWEVPPASAGFPLSLQFSFVAQGRDAFSFRLPPSLRLKSVEATLDVSGSPGATIPDHALQPTQAADSLLEWRFENLVSGRAITLDFPGSEGPSGRVQMLFHLAAVAILLFGSGFWYFMERDFPGRMDAFRWQHFMPLVFSYALFFAAFAILVFHAQPLGIAIAIAAAVSLPLATTYIARIASTRFALSKALPLAAITLTLVVNGVYGGTARDFIFLGVAAAIVAGYTLTYRPNWRRPERHRAGSLA